MYRLAKTSSPIVDQTFHKKQSYSVARSACFWAIINLVMALFMCYELSFRPILGYFSLEHVFFWYAECALTVVFVLNTFIDLMKYLSPSFTSAIVDLTPNQKRLMGIKDTDLGFRLSQKRLSPGMMNPGSSIIQPCSPSSFTSHSSISRPSSPYSPTQHMNLGSSPQFMPRVSPDHRTPSPSSRTPSPSHYDLSGVYNANVSQSGSFIQASSAHNLSAQGSSHTSFNKSTMSPQGSTATHSPLFRESLDSSLRFRPSRSSLKNSPMSAGDSMTDMKALESFLKEEQEKEMRSFLGNPENSPGNSQSFWNYGRSVTDYSPVLKKYQYQIACRTAPSTKSTSVDPDDPITFRADEVWMRLGVHSDEVEVWIENLRKWISQTVMTRLVEEIDKINRRLLRIGCDDMQIGEVSISTLKSLAVTKSPIIPTLNTVIPFLEVGNNQEYLIQRIRELGRGGCIHEFRWNSGGEFKGKPWGEHLPTDAAIIMHALCTYMDSRLPAHPKFPDGKTFTNQHFIKSPDKPDLKKKDNLLIYQFKINPPHFKVITEDDTWDLTKGRNNMFQAILLFIHQIKMKQNGMLGRVNLGLTGINILWVLESNMMS